eukprot:CAMPEP_0171354442 /NCGR_PEP_ID=MMETSP0878-20121228/44709_1 /TAXON_ID=67004 /ORGANISM="Thalassiosira weissflogii, Strain CCMP1336" /LENGTH=263 /DNA_ID=CAMNT_0011860415 /DNA_START=597 /DNA_END=1388 /DNA_ORIENTATION=-
MTFNNSHRGCNASPTWMRIIAALLAIFSLTSLPASLAAAPAPKTASSSTTTTTSSSSSSSLSSSKSTTLASAAAGGVIVLNAKNFDSSLRDGKVWLIEFYAPWCGHCSRFAPAYEQVAQTLHSQQPTSPRKVNVAKIDGAAERALSSRFGVRAFPTFFLVDGWTVREYDGNRSKELLVKFAMESYEDVEPVPFLFGPFGPMGQVRAFLMRCGSEIVGVYEKLTKEKGLSPLVAMAILCSVGMGLGLVMIVVVGFLLLRKAKLD